MKKIQILLLCLPLFVQCITKKDIASVEQISIEDKTADTLQLSNIQILQNDTVSTADTGGIPVEIYSKITEGLIPSPSGVTFTGQEGLTTFLFLPIEDLPEYVKHTFPTGFFYKQSFITTARGCDLYYVYYSRPLNPLYDFNEILSLEKENMATREEIINSLLYFVEDFKDISLVNTSVEASADEEIISVSCKLNNEFKDYTIEVINKKFKSVTWFENGYKELRYIR